MQTIQILGQTETILDQAKITTYNIVLPEPTKFMSVHFGFDPGTVHAGVAQIDPANNTAKVIQITMIRLDAMRRIRHIQYVLNNCPFIFPAFFEVTIEGPSYGDKYRQNELSEIRTSTALWFERYGGNCHFVPPASIRKQLFGNGRTKAEQMWSGLPNDALASLSCAYYWQEV